MTKNYLTRIINDFEPNDYIPMNNSNYPNNGNHFDKLDYINDDCDDILIIQDCGDGIVLYRDLNDYDEYQEALLIQQILKELKRLSYASKEFINKKSNKNASLIRNEKDKLTLYFTYANIIQEYYLQKCIIKYNILDENEEQNITGGNGWSVKKCMDILYQEGIIDDGLKGEINKVRKFRNSEVHGMRRWIFGIHYTEDKYNIYKIKNAINSGERSVVRLIELATDIKLEN